MATPQTANAIVLFQLLQLGALAFLLTTVR